MIKIYLVSPEIKVYLLKNYERGSIIQRNVSQLATTQVQKIIDCLVVKRMRSTGIRKCDC